MQSMIEQNIAIKYYQQEEIQKEIAYNAKNREVAARFNDQFGSRPDVINYPNDVFELAKQGATSFHASEELWKNPMQLSPMMKKRELDELRAGWDLVLDIDCPNWEYSKLIAHLMIKALKSHNVKSIGCKFSGNKGFHIGVPFEAFPKTLPDKELKDYFPDGVRMIAEYLISYIDSKETDFEFTREITKDRAIAEIAAEFGKDVIKTACKKCGREKKKESERLMEIECPYCQKAQKVRENVASFSCERCRKIVKDIGNLNSNICQKCKGREFIQKLDTSKILNVDAVLISSRHLFRMPYSLHEKSGLCSIPINPDKILGFDKTLAKPNYARISKFRFLDKENVEKGNAARLFDEAFQWNVQMQKKEEMESIYQSESVKKTYEIPQSALSEDYFPPCMKKAFLGLKDGKKRFLFIAVNFLSSVGWSYEDIEKRIGEWNKKNEEPLRENYIVGQVRYHKQNKKKILPPNCSSDYYRALGLCAKDNLCEKIKNPVNYSLRKVRFKEKDKKEEKN